MGRGITMSCCDNPNYVSSTYSDECLNCGWSFDYINGIESYNTPYPSSTNTYYGIPTHGEDKDE